MRELTHRDASVSTYAGVHFTYRLMCEGRRQVSPLPCTILGPHLFLVNISSPMSNVSCCLLATFSKQFLQLSFTRAILILPQSRLARHTYCQHMHLLHLAKYFTSHASSAVFLLCHLTFAHPLAHRSLSAMHTL